MSAEELMSQVMEEPQITVAEIDGLCARIVEQQAKVDAIAEQQKAAKRELDALEKQCAKAISMAGKLQWRSSGRNWTPVVDLHINVTKANRDAVIEAAKKVKLDPVSVNTSTIKGWLREEMDKRIDAGTAGERYAEGTVFDGLISEYSELKLSSRKVS